MSHHQTIIDADRVRKEIESRERILKAWAWLESNEFELTRNFIVCCSDSMKPDPRFRIKVKTNYGHTVYSDSLLEAIEMVSLTAQPKTP